MSIIQAIHHLYQKTFGSSPAELIPLKRTASGRHYFRIVDADKTYIATYGADPKENEAFIYFSKHFKEKGMPVPEIFAVDSEQGIYLQEDLGSQSLYDLLPEAKEDLGENLKAIYKKVLTQLARLQIKGGQGLDYSKCVPHSDFDRQSMYWDLNYFKYFFLKLSTVTFDEAALEKDFQGLMDFLLQADRTHFMYRDFQSRNIMIRQGQPYFVDYQGGRRGALQYDVASLLYQPAAAMSEATREELLKHYLEEVAQHKTIDVGSFMQLFYAYVLIRRLQALGTYGLRGIHERYTHFLKSIPIALAQIRSLFDENKIAIPLPELKRLIRSMDKSKPFTSHRSQAAKQLTVRVHSFSYRDEIPHDPSGNGGGFVFDCRFLNNPGRHEPYKKLTGRDPSVIEFLKAHSNIEDFLQHTFFLVDEAVENYLQRGFEHLMVSFGCTGGQHRSVYSADQMAKHLKEKYGLKVILHHIEQERKGWVN